ncbi:MAG: DUF3619 family protein [Curvibacter sp.]|jgi:hypothetical protein|nr:DUF3619 family protein [Curvibacter sp.]
MRNPISIDEKVSAQDRFGRRVAAGLDACAENLSHDISQRLRFARQQALEKHRVVHQATLATLGHAGGAAVLGGGDDERSLWPRLVALVPLLALIAGLVTLQVLGSDEFTEELAELDAAILTDDLPPDAYADPGFAQFLKNRLNALQQN